MKNESDRIRSRIKRTLTRLYREDPVPYGWDWPTLCSVKPEVAIELRQLSRELKILKAAGL